MGNNKIEDWYRALSAGEQADTDEFLKNMRMVQDWSMPDYRPRLANSDGLGELRWLSDNKQHRLLGFFFKGSWCAVQGCTHKQTIYKPPDSLETAKRYKRQIERGEVKTVEYDL